MKYYYEESVFSFGKHKGKKLIEIAQKHPAYISWCVINLQHFCILPSTLDRLKKIKGFYITKKTEDALKQKILNLSNQKTRKNFYDPDNNSRSFRKYGAYNGWSDEDIDDVFDGDPSLTWNLE